ncbi:MAG: cupin domain-containing protein [Vulcanimicrobiota bacterium]
MRYLLLALVAVTGLAAAQPVLHTDDRQLSRDHQVPPLKLVGPQLWPQVPWQQVGPGIRRRVLYSDRLTMVLLEIEAPVDDQPLQTHYHIHDQVTYLLEGRGLVSVAGQEMEVAAGGAYSVPSNVHHGLKPLTPRLVLVECFTPTREDFRQSLTENEVRSFVYQWFSLFDRTAPAAAFLPYLDGERMVVEFPERTLRSHQDFETWYAEVVALFPRVSHQVRNLEVQAEGAGFSVRLEVGWTPEGQATQWFRQQWIIDGQSGRPQIVSYKVTPL